MRVNMYTIKILKKKPRCGSIAPFDYYNRNGYGNTANTFTV